ncbi:ABC transporter substrate-binding protein [Sulfitobacter sp. G21635-S1]|uniref:ABC transporter substrate-binding protein n=1 Tax=Sulfitobacter sp. G21635-S1 TaxID=3014043 RepID=UPI0022AF37A5|nr:ABC transporter substrate-binding protein [Sulfitobacter sp. G21635-S1]MCZ4255462.1 ABC transporter substrate-binding protein [Sulfitobacter sp. G21635-S1]
MTSRRQNTTRRSFLAGGTGLVAGALAGFPMPALAKIRPVRVGIALPRTGPLALFAEHLPFVMDQVERATKYTVDVGGSDRQVEFVIKDTQSSPNRASQVALELILDDGVDVIMASGTPETTNPVADQCELNGMPCLTTEAPLEPYFLGRKGDPAVGFEWTNHFYFSGTQAGGAILQIFGQVDTNRVVGALWPNDSDGNTFAQIFPPVLAEQGMTLSDPGRFDMPLASYSAAVAKFKADNVEIVHGIIPPPEFTTFYNEAIQQNFIPKVLYAGKTSAFPSALETFGERAHRLVTEVPWGPQFPYTSPITGQTAAEVVAEYHAASGRQWNSQLGFKLAMFEVLFAGLARVEDLDDPESVQKGISAISDDTIVGRVDFSKGPFPNTAVTPIAGGQWLEGTEFPLRLAITENTFAPDVKVEATTLPMLPA